MRYAFALIAFFAVPAQADTIDPVSWDQIGAADIVIVGEVHDNPRHHHVQAEIAQTLQPAAVVFEMLTFRQASLVRPDNRTSEESLREILDWDNSGWPDFAMYYPIFAAAPDAQIFGAQVPRTKARAAMQDGVEQVFGPDAETYGLPEPLPAVQQSEREAFQQDAHCGALPEDMLPAMVAVQRLRDAELARVALQALDKTGGPVLVITGNGHARADWGMPVYLDRVRPAAQVITIGQSEDGNAPAGQFDITLDAPSVARDDPCAAFQ